MDIRPSILSIDNNTANQRLITAVLSPHYQVETAMSGGQALRKLEELTPDLILMDIDMPGMDGLQTCRSVRANPKYAYTPIVFLSCLGSRDDQLRAFNCGGDDYITKPFDIEILRAKVNVHLQRSRRHTAGNSVDALPIEESLVQLRQVNFYLLALLKSPSLSSVCDLTLENLDKIGLKGALRIHRRPDLTCSSCGPLTDLENSLLCDALTTEHLQLSARFVLGSPQAAMMIQNMPSGGSAHYAALQELLFIVFEAFNVKVQSLMARLEPELAASNTGALVADFDQFTPHFEQALRAIEHQSDKELGDILAQIEAMQSHPGSALERSHMAVVEARLQLVKERLLIQCMELEGRFLHWVSGGAKNFHL